MQVLPIYVGEVLMAGMLVANSGRESPVRDGCERGRFIMLII